MTKLVLTPVQSALVDLADRERTRRLQQVKDQINAAHALVGQCVECVFREHGSGMPSEGVPIQFERDSNGLISALVWEEPKKPEAAELPSAQHMKEHAHGAPSH